MSNRSWLDTLMPPFYDMTHREHIRLMDEAQEREDRDIEKCGPRHEWGE